ARCVARRVGAARLPCGPPAPPGAYDTAPRRSPSRPDSDPNSRSRALEDADQVRLAHEAACRTDHTPDPSELGNVLTQHLPRLAISDVVVDRASCVSDLHGAVRPPRRAQEASIHSRGRTRPCLHDIRRPSLRARTRAAALTTVVGREPVSRSGAPAHGEPTVRRRT